MSGVDGLGWVTNQQQAQLNELWEIRGDWRDWLPGELDARWPGWRDAGEGPEREAELVADLDNLISMLVLPSGLEAEDLAQINATVIDPVLQEIYQELAEWDAQGQLSAEVKEAIVALQATPEVLAAAIVAGIEDANYA